MANVIVDELFDIAKDVCVALMGRAGHGGNSRGMLSIMLVVGSGWLGVEDKRNGEESFDPFYKLIPPVCLYMEC